MFPDLLPLLFLQTHNFLHVHLFLNAFSRLSGGCGSGGILCRPPALAAS